MKTVLVCWFIVATSLLFATVGCGKKDDGAQECVAYMSSNQTQTNCN